MSDTANAIRDQIVTMLQDMVPGTFAVVERTALLQPDEADFPRCGVFLTRVGDSEESDGNHGQIRFVEDVTVGLSILDRDTDPAAVETRIDETQAATVERILNDEDFTRLHPGALFESVTGIQRTKVYPPSGSSIFVLEWRVELTFRTRIGYSPTITTPFAGVNLRGEPVRRAPNGELIHDQPGTPDSGFVLDLEQ